MDPWALPPPVGYWLRRIGKQNSLQIIVVGIIFHSVASMLMIYWHVNEFMSHHESGGKFEPTNIRDQQGGFQWATRSIRSNLLADEIRKLKLKYKYDYEGELINIENYPERLLMDGNWWETSSSGSASSTEKFWKRSVNCFNNKDHICSQVLSVDCSPQASHTLHRFIDGRNLRFHGTPSYSILSGFQVSAKALTNDLFQMHENATFGVHVTIELEGHAVGGEPKGTNTNNRIEFIRLTFPVDTDHSWVKRSLPYAISEINRQPPQTTIIGKSDDTEENEIIRTKHNVSSLMISLDCFGYTGRVSFTDIQVQPTWTDGNNNHHQNDDATSSIHLPPENLHTPIEPVAQTSRGIEFETLIEFTRHETRNKNDTVTLVTHTRMSTADNLVPHLKWALEHWSGPISLAIHIPILDEKDAVLKRVIRERILSDMKSLGITTNERVESSSRIQIILMWHSRGNDGGMQSSSSYHYPYGTLINRALGAVQTEYVFLLADPLYQPSPHFSDTFSGYVPHNNQLPTRAATRTDNSFKEKSITDNKIVNDHHGDKLSGIETDNQRTMKVKQEHSQQQQQEIYLIPPFEYVDFVSRDVPMKGNINGNNIPHESGSSDRGPNWIIREKRGLLNSIHGATTQFVRPLGEVQSYIDYWIWYQSSEPTRIEDMTLNGHVISTTPPPCLVFRRDLSILVDEAHEPKLIAGEQRLPLERNVPHWAFWVQILSSKRFELVLLPDDWLIRLPPQQEREFHEDEFLREQFHRFRALRNTII